MRGRIAGVRNIAELAAKNGAMNCAPRELALARAHLEFSELALAEGSLSRAQAQLATAEANANAALGQSPPEHCSGLTEPLAGDRDGDGYLDPADSCPEAAETYNGFQDGDGCPDDPDTDGDGLSDSHDPCPIAAEDVDQYLDADGCPEADNDLDGVDDAKDACPLDPEDPEGYEDADGCPDLDNDGDEVPDLEDECPNTPGQKVAAPKGCPLNSLVVVTDCEVKITQQIHFETGKDKIRPESFPILDAVVEVLENNADIKLQIQGHTDDVGTNKNNMDLSTRRAASVRKYLVSHGVGVERLESAGFGEEVPLVENNSTENRALNRRVQFMRTEGQKAGCGEAKTGAESATSTSTPSGSP